MYIDYTSKALRLDLVPVQLSSTIAESGSCLLRCNIALRFSHKLIPGTNDISLSFYIDLLLSDNGRRRTSTHPTKNFLTFALLNSGG